jgi:hypothetical protein
MRVELFLPNQVYAIPDPDFAIFTRTPSALNFAKKAYKLMVYSLSEETRLLSDDTNGSRF